jgi:pimeloyl-ACP methyl ester carboxylesterase
MRRVLPVLVFLCALILAAAALSAWFWTAWPAFAGFGLAALAALPFGVRTRRAALLRAVVVFLGVGVAVATIRPAADNSIYASPDIAAEAERLYAAALDEWPVAYESRMLDTARGRVHVIVSGPEDGAPMLLLHASAMGGWSWHHNVAALSEAGWRTYAIDLVGDIGRSAYRDLSDVMRSGADQARHYVEVMDLLGVERAVVTGASEGGFIASNLAIHAPEGVERLILLGPMGYRGAGRAAARITLAQLFPAPAMQRATFRWAFSDDPDLIAEFSDWFTLATSGMLPAKVPPLPLSPEERARITAPVLFVFGTRDRVVGDPEAAAAHVSDMADARIEIVEAGHLMAAEVPEVIDALILDFAGRPGASPSR